MMNMETNKIKLGAIRWDAWVGNLNPVGLEVEQCLTPKKYHNRIPFYASIHQNEVQIRCDSKRIIRQEIDYASKYGIDYFAFCWYPFHSGLDTARNLFLEIEQSKIAWCLIIGTNPFNESDALWLINQFSKENYLRIHNRPVVYIFNINKSLLKIVNYIRKNSKDDRPYFVGMVWNKEQAESMNRLFKLDAITQYCTPGKNNISYKEIRNLEISKWNEYRTINKVVPWITTGWDKRPRYDFPVSWENCEHFDTQYIEKPTLSELKDTLHSAYQFQKENQDELILLYAWNEFDEGGFIEPTLTDNGSIDMQKLQAIKEVVDCNTREN